MAKLYIEDINAARSLARIMPINVIVNVFRLNENQKQMVEGKKRPCVHSINNETNKKKSNRKVDFALTPRMVEAAATLNYMGLSQKEISEWYDCDVTTVSKRLSKYHGWESRFSLNDHIIK